MNSGPRPYGGTLSPRMSALRPHCLAVDRIGRWLPAVQGAAEILTLNSASLRKRITDNLLVAYHPSTLATMGTGLLHFHVFCDKEGVSEVDRCPCSNDLLSMFIVALSGLYSGNY